MFRFLRVIVANALLLLALFVVGEVVVRSIAEPRDGRIWVGSTALSPTWADVVDANRQSIESDSYFVFDPELGWTVGSNRSTPDGMYYSSVEGIRTGAPNLRLADREPQFRVALIGDSNAFSYEVPFEESWGYYLEQELGPDFQVLNFGVDGYGIGQMCLRYERDVRPWRPDVVLIGFIGHDLRRTMVVYPFVSLGWTGYLVKPRFVVSGEQLDIVNAPLPDPATLLAAGSPLELSHIGHDAEFRAEEWKARPSIFLRYIRARTSAPRTTPSLDPDTADLNQRLLVRLAKSIRDDGATAVFLLMQDPDGGLEEMAKAGLRQEGIELWLAEPWLVDLSPQERSVPSGYHYSGLANHLIARETGRLVGDVLKP